MLIVPVSLLVPEPLLVRFLIPANLAPTRSVAPEKVRVRSLPAPAMPVVNVPTLPVSTVLAPKVICSL